MVLSECLYNKYIMSYHTESDDTLNFKNIEDIVISNLRKTLKPLICNFESRSEKYNALTRVVRLLPEFQELIQENADLKLKLSEYNISHTDHIGLKITEKSDGEDSVEFIAEKNADTKLMYALTTNVESVIADDDDDDDDGDDDGDDDDDDDGDADDTATGSVQAVVIKKESYRAWGESEASSDADSEDEMAESEEAIARAAQEVQRVQSMLADQEEERVLDILAAQEEEEEEEEEEGEEEVNEDENEEVKEVEVEVEENGEEEVEVEEVEEEEEEEVEVEVEEVGEEDDEEDENDEENEEEEVEEEEEEEVEEEEEEVGEEEEEEVGEEEEEVFMIELDGVHYYTSDDTNGDIYSIGEDEDVGDKVGYFKDGEPYID